MPFIKFFRRLRDSVGIGGLATMVDLVALTLLVEFGLTPEAANVPALALGAVVQFVGCRHIIFPNARTRSMRSQLLGFAGVELGGFVLNALLFHALFTITSVPYPVVRLACLFLVFVGFSFPMWHVVFARQQARPAVES